MRRESPSVGSRSNVPFLVTLTSGASAVFFRCHVHRDVAHLGAVLIVSWHEHARVKVHVKTITTRRLSPRVGFPCPQHGAVCGGNVAFAVWCVVSRILSKSPWPPHNINLLACLRKVMLNVMLSFVLVNLIVCLMNGLTPFPLVWLNVFLILMPPFRHVLSLCLRRWSNMSATWVRSRFAVVGLRSVSSLSPLV